MEKLIRLSEIRLDGGTQPRTEIDQDLVSEYAECIDQLPPVTVFFDGVKYWLADGFHRFFAHNKAGKGEIRADIRTGTQRDAILFSVGVNACHGKRRSNEDKRKAVLTLLKMMNGVSGVTARLLKSAKYPTPLLIPFVIHLKRFQVIDRREYIKTSRARLQQWIPQILAKNAILSQFPCLSL